MREIKFRAWDSRDKMMWYQSNLISFHFSGREGWTCWSELNTPRSKCVAGCGLTDDALMQFTNFKDKNGTEIYERDICRVGHAQELSEVIFKDSCFFYQSKLGDLLFCDAPICEIIGNIYENLEY